MEFTITNALILLLPIVIMIPFMGTKHHKATNRAASTLGYINIVFLAIAIMFIARRWGFLIVYVGVLIYAYIIAAIVALLYIVSFIEFCKGDDIKKTYPTTKEKIGILLITGSLGVITLLSYLFRFPFFLYLSSILLFVLLFLFKKIR